VNSELKVEGYTISNHHPFIVAEVGINHNGDMGLAKECIAAAAEAGADSVKFQSYKTEDFIFDRSLMFTYLSQGKKVKESQFEMFKRCEINRDNILFLKQECDKHGVNFHSTPTSLAGIKDLEFVGSQLLKNGSDYLTNLELIRAMGETGLTTVLSTGMATLTDIDEAVETFRSTGNEKLILLHCTSAYPTPAEEVNLARLGTLSSAFGVPVGFSDHSKGVTAAVAATVLGTCWIEKHFTLDRNLPGPDHWFSMDPSELTELVDSVRSAEKMVGDAKIIPTVSELESRKNFRLSCVARDTLEKGHVVTDTDIVFRRPGNGLVPRDSKHIVGRVVKEVISAGSVFSNDMFK